MKADFTQLWAESPGTLRREPTNAELGGGFPCGDLDLQLFNELFFRLSQAQREILYAITQSGQTPNANNTTQLWAAIQSANSPASLVHYAVAAGTANAITVDETPGIPALAPGMQLELLVTTTNTGPVTLDVGAGGAKAVQRRAAQPLLPGDLSAGINLLVYDGTAWRVQGFAASDIPAIIATYWRLDSPSVSVPAGSLTILSNYANRISTVGIGTTVGQGDGQVIIGPSDGGVYILSATNAVDQSTTEESIYIFRNGSPIATSRSALGDPGSNAMDKSVTAVIRLAPSDVVSAVYFQQNPTNTAFQSLNQPLGHFGGVRVGG